LSGLLLDTQALIWWALRSPRLSAPAHAAILARAGSIYVSVASIYEADYKTRVGRMPPLPVSAADLVRAEGFLFLAVDEFDAARAASFPPGHSDPFDRLIAAQAQLRGIEVATRDPALSALGAQVLW